MTDSPPADKVLFLTEPNLPAAGAAALAGWVASGGTLVTVSNAAHLDEYNTPDRALHDALRTGERPRPRVVWWPWWQDVDHHITPRPPNPARPSGAALVANGTASACAAGGSCGFEAWGAD